MGSAVGQAAAVGADGWTWELTRGWVGWRTVGSAVGQVEPMGADGWTWELTVNAWMGRLADGSTCSWAGRRAGSRRVNMPFGTHFKCRDTFGTHFGDNRIRN